MKWIFTIFIIIIGLMILSCKGRNFSAGKILPFLSSSSSPRIIGFSPGRNEKGLKGNSTVNLIFDRPMKMDQCIQSFSISPPVRGYYETSDFTLKYIPVSPLENGTYSITLTKSCEDREGRDISDLFTNSFTVGDSVNADTVLNLTEMKVYSGSVLNCSNGTSVLSDFLNGSVNDACLASSGSGNTLKLVFSESMESVSLRSSLSISPSVPYAFSVSADGKTASLKMDNPLNYGQRYSVTVSASAKSVSGLTLKNPVSASFLAGGSSSVPNISAVTVNTGLYSDCNAGTGISSVNFLSSQVNNACASSNSVWIFFSEAMDRNSAQSAVSFSPSIAGTFQWLNGDKTLQFIPDSSLISNTRYTVMINSTARSLNSVSLPSSVSANFLTNTAPPPVLLSSLITSGTSVGCLNLVGTSDQDFYGGTVSNVCAGTVTRNKIIYTFNEPMDAVSVQSGILMTPNIPGAYLWSAGNTVLTFTPDSAYSAGSRYSFGISGSVKSASGTSIGAVAPFSFLVNQEIPPPFLTSVVLTTGTSSNCIPLSGTVNTDLLISSPMDACIGSVTRNSIQFSFSEPMDTVSAQSGISFSPAVTGAYSWSAGNTVLTFTPDSAFNSDTRYSISFSALVKSSWKVSMTPISPLSFRTNPSLPAPTVTSITVTAGTVSSCLNLVGTSDLDILSNNVQNACTGTVFRNPILISFSEPMDSASVIASLSLSPNFPHSLYWNAAKTVFTVLPDSAYSFGSRISLALGTVARSQNGISLSSTVTGSFVIGSVSSSPKVQSVGLKSQSCPNVAPGIGNPSGGDWNLGSCFWDNSLPILGQSSYLFRAGDTGNGFSGSMNSCTDSDTDNFRIIFDSYMDTAQVMNYVRLDRISPPFTTVRLASWEWTDCQASYPFGCRVLTLIYSEQEASCNGALFGNGTTGGDFNLMRTDNMPAGVPVYTLTVGSGARDANGISIGTDFRFSMEGK